MAQLDFKVDEKRCTRCGACVRDCVVHIIKQEDGSIPTVPPELEADCLECQHCLAVCPTAAISVFGIDPDSSLELKAGELPSAGQFERLIRGRRSVRQYRNENVSPELLKELLAAVANSPTGCNSRSLVFTVIDDKATMTLFLERIIEGIESAQKAGRIPEKLAFMSAAVNEYRQNRTDLIFRGAPHALIVSASPDVPCPVEDVMIALTYFELLAQCAGLGTLWCGYLKFALDTLPELKDMIGLSQGRSFYPVLFGHPAVKYARTIQRDNAASIQHVKF